MGRRRSSMVEPNTVKRNQAMGATQVSMAKPHTDNSLVGNMASSRAHTGSSLDSMDSRRHNTDSNLVNTGNSPVHMANSPASTVRNLPSMDSSPVNTVNNLDSMHNRRPQIRHLDHRVNTAHPPVEWRQELWQASTVLELLAEHMVRPRGMVKRPGMVSLYRLDHQERAV